ncbi:hypothetical protein PWT90_07647 [Aphanocladium album]|nr:hypothetical protein PWT90_07647 [Aphanocladium album]
MAAAAEEIDDEELQRRVLQATLDEVAAAHPEEDCCVICLDAISDPCELVPCGHAHFDLPCATTWFAGHTACPLCKRHVGKILHGARGVKDRPVVDVVAVAAAAAASINTTNTTNTTNTINTTNTTGAFATTGGFHVPASLDRHRWERRERDDDPLRPGARRTRWPRWPPPMTDPARGQSADVEFRRQIYADNRFSMHVGSNRVSQYQELTPDMFRRDQHLVSRARMFVRRELQVFSFLSHADPEFVAPPPQPAQPAPGRISPSHWRPPSVADSTTAQPGMASQRRTYNAEFLLEYIVSILKSVDIMGSVGAALDMLADFLGREHARLFLHELRAWLRSPYTRLEDWDRAVQYPTAEQQQQQQQQQSQDRDAERQERHERREPDHWRPGGQRDESSRGAGPRQKGDYYRPGGANMDRWLQSAGDGPNGGTDVYSLNLDHQRHLHSVRDYRY